MFELGKEYKIQGSSIIGILIEKDERSMIGKIEIKGKLIKVKLNSLVPPKNSDNSSKRKELQKNIDISPRKNAISNLRASLDLHGMTRDEAREALVCFLDQSLLNNLNEIELIHGHGTGKIKAVVIDFLSRSSYVSHFKTQENNPGTIIAYLK
ncbi:MAG TPA: Smr/MutS family protein [Oligoflexia bacterium]|nr:Smr/MutS family protein [Oligoflexia bacterium]HMP47591.1 Smr/MutS family protein [Oligoflexia bacterium]